MTTTLFSSNEPSQVILITPRLHNGGLRLLWQVRQNFFSTTFWQIGGCQRIREHIAWQAPADSKHGQMWNVTTPNLADQFQLGFLAMACTMPGFKNLAPYEQEAFREMSSQTIPPKIKPKTKAQSGK